MEKEIDFLFEKKVRCPVCDNIFGSKVVRTSRLRRLQPDFDLRPRFRDIDTLKYSVYACPFCGYSAINTSFDQLSKGQIMLVKENVTANFKPSGESDPEVYDYNTAIARYKRALLCSKAKRGKMSELAYTCLKISWLYRSMGDEMPESTKEECEAKEEVRKNQELFYKEAYQGFQKALTMVDFPICGMDTFTMDFLLATLACHFKEYGFASKAVSNILGSQIADRRMKDRALDLKQEIVSKMRAETPQ